jgi:hypothetical protein
VCACLFVPMRTRTAVGEAQHKVRHGILPLLLLPLRCGHVLVVQLYDLVLQGKAVQCGTYRGTSALHMRYNTQCKVVAG